jgi:hypothetical protein
MVGVVAASHDFPFRLSPGRLWTLAQQKRSEHKAFSDRSANFVDNDDERSFALD